jgi:hypothetical protein
MNRLSSEAEALLKEILDHENDKQYWGTKFESFSAREVAIARGCFNELQDSNLIKVQWGDNSPYFIWIQKDGYLYTFSNDNAEGVSAFEQEFKQLLDRTKNIKAPINTAPYNVDINEYNRPSRDWLNDAEIFFNKYLTKHPLAQRMESLFFHRQQKAYIEIKSCLESISRDTAFISEINGKHEANNVKKTAVNQYDVFISHANKDKEDFVEELYNSITKLGVSVFYDKTSLEWGDNWKNIILEGTRKAEFAIIVISENFFGKEWTEIELNEFLTRQNKVGQKTILPVVHNITIEDLRKKYPEVADIQAISSKEHTCDEVALLFAKQLIKRLKS